ncbi:hypothetical protein KM043_001294 [Ampulex compressa]|nr:hypothetical protein KM043_001294 [Ampulex compressa]
MSSATVEEVRLGVREDIDGIGSSFSKRVNWSFGGKFDWPSDESEVGKLRNDREGSSRGTWANRGWRKKTRPFIENRGFGAAKNSRELIVRGSI